MDQQQLIKQYQDLIRGYLDKLTERLVTKLHVIAHAAADPQTFLLQFEVEMQDFTRGFPVYWYVMDKNAVPLEAALPASLLPHIPFTVPEEVTEAEEYEALREDQAEVDYETLTAWFAECWHMADGLNYPFPAYIAQHDSTYSLNLRELTEVHDDEKWNGADG